MSFHSIQKPDSVACVLWRAITATVLFAIAPLALAQQVLTPATISFGNVPLTVPVTQTGTFTNNSTFQPVTITGLSTSDVRFVAAGSGASPCNVSAVVSFGASCTYALTFTPTGTGAYNNTTTVAYNLVTTPLTLTQASNGTGIIPPSTASPSSILFGNVPLTVVANQTFTFTNNSNTTSFPAPYTLTSFATTGLGFSAVGSGGTPCAVGLVLPPAASCQGTASFQIGGTGSSNGTTTISFQTGQGANPTYNTAFALNGTGFIPPSTLTPPSIAFGNVSVGTPVTQTATFTNNSNATAFPSTYHVDSLSVSGLGYTVAGSGATPCVATLMLPPGQSCGFTVTFTPAGAGASGGTVTIGFGAALGTDPPYSQALGLSGNGISTTTSQTGLPSMTVVPGLGVSMNIAVSGSVGTPTGSVTVKLRNLTTMVVTDINGGTCLMASLTSGSFTCPFITPAADNYSVEVSYSGDGTYSPTLKTFSLITAQAVPTIAQTGSPSNAVPGQSVSMMLNVSSSSPLGPPTGIVTVKLRNLTTMIVTDINGGTCLMASLTSGSFTCPYIAPSAGNYQIEVSYSGDTPNAPVLKTFSLTTAQAVPTVTQIGSPASAPPGQSVSMAISVTSSSPLGPPTGIVTVKLRDLTTMIVTDINGGTCLMASLTSGSFTCPYTTPVVGNYQIEVSYSGDTPNAPAFQIFPLTVAAALTPTMTVAFAPGSVSTNTNATLTLTLGNPLAAPATMSIGGSVTMPLGLSLSGLVDGCGASASVIVSTVTTINLGMGGTIPAFGSCTITVQAKSATPGSFPVTVLPGNLITALGNNTNTSTATLTVSPATATYSPAGGLAFGNRTVGATSTPLTATFTNTSAISLTLSSISFLGGGAGFNVLGTSQCLTTPTVAPAGSCTFDITATPASVGAFTDNVVVLTLPASTTTPANVVLSVTGVASAPVITLTPPSVVFGARTVNTTSPATLVTLGNAGTGLLTITSITASGDFGFTTSCPISPASLAISLACPINITFTPLTATAITGSITIVSNAPGSPHTITLTGTGTALPVPGISLVPPALTFAAQTASTSSATQNVVVTNTGFANLTLSAISVGAPFSRVALVSASPPDCATSVAPSSSCQIGVIFTPIAAGSFTGQISITDNASGSPHKVALSGVGTSVAVPVINVNGTLAFGDQVINSGSNAQSLTITNTGAATLSVSAITLSGTNAANFTLSGQSACTSIAPTSSCTLTVTFAATTTGAKTAQINITSNAQNAALVNSVSLSANGILAPRPLLSVTSTAIGFGNVIFGGATPYQGITLTNSGGQAMNIVSIVAVGDFVQMNNCGSSLAPLATCTISIVFTPLLQGNRFGELILTTNATTSPDRIPLSGTGCRWFSQAQSRFFLTSCGG